VNIQYLTEAIPPSGQNIVGTWQVDHHYHHLLRSRLVTLLKFIHLYIGL